MARTLTLLGALGLLFISVPPGLALEQVQEWTRLAQSRSELCIDCRSNCDKTGHEDAHHCQTSSIRDSRFDFNKCISDMHIVQRLCEKQCGDLECSERRTFTPHTYTSPFQR
jgi:hypothetical protein